MSPQITEFAEAHAAEPRSLEWDEGWVAAMDEATLFAVLEAANYLDFQRLFMATCRAVATQLQRFSTPDQIKGLFDVNEPFTEEEAEKLHIENPWIDE